MITICIEKYPVLPIFPKMSIEAQWRYEGAQHMKNKAIIRDQEYTLLEILPSLDGGPALILCVDSDDHRAICSESLW